MSTPGDNSPSSRSPTAAEAKAKAEAKASEAKAAAKEAKAAAKDGAHKAMDLGLGSIKKGINKAKELEHGLEKTMHVKDLMKFADLAVFGTTAEADEFEWQEQQRLKSKWCGMLHPDTGVSNIYDMIQMVLLIYLLFTLPYNLAFDIMAEPNSFAFWMEISVDVALGFDMILSFFRFQVHPRTFEIISDKKIIRARYLKGWFWLDGLALFPFDHALRLYLELTDCTGPDCAGARNAARSSRMIRLGKLSRFTRLSKLLKLSHLKSMGDVFIVFMKNVGVSKLGVEFVMKTGGLTFILIACTHLLGCLWLHMGASGLEDAYLSRDPVTNESDGKNWMLAQYGWEGATDVETYYQRYVDATYWVSVVISSVGYGDITPISEGERLFCITTITFGAFLNAYIVGSFTIMISNLGQDKANYDAKTRSINELFKFLNVPEELTERVEDFYSQKYMNKTMFNEDLLAELPTRLRAEMTLHRFRPVIQKVPFFHGCREDAVVDICMKLKSHSTMPNDDIVTRGEPYRELLILTNGKARSVPSSSDGVFGPDPGNAASRPDGSLSPRSPRSPPKLAPTQLKEMDAVIEYVEGSFFGELEFLGISSARSMTVRAQRFCEVSTLNPLDIQDVLDIHIGLKRRLQRYGVLKQDMQNMMEDESLDEMAIEQMKQRIEQTFEDTEENELKAVFDATDGDGDGCLDLEEFEIAITQLGIELSHAAVKVAFEECDRKGKGDVSFDEFLTWWGENENKMRAAHHDETLGDAARDSQTRITAVEMKIEGLQASMQEALALLGGDVA